MVEEFRVSQILVLYQSFVQLFGNLKLLAFRSLIGWKESFLFAEPFVLVVVLVQVLRGRKKCCMRVSVCIYSVSDALRSMM